MPHAGQRQAQEHNGGIEMHFQANVGVRMLSSWLVRDWFWLASSEAKSAIILLNVIFACSVARDVKVKKWREKVWSLSFEVIPHTQRDCV